MLNNGMNSGESSIAALDRYIAPGLRLWMLIALVSGILLIMVVIVCCFMRIRIPRTKRQIDLIAAKRKMRKAKMPSVTSHQDEHPAILLKTVKDSSITRNNSGNNAHDGVIVSETLPLFQKTRTTTTV